MAAEAVEAAEAPDAAPPRGAQGTNRVLIEGRVGERYFNRYPATEPKDGKRGKRRLLSFQISRGDCWFTVQAYEDAGDKALAEGLKPGDWVFVHGALRSSRFKAACGRVHAFVNIVARSIERLDRARGHFDDEAALGEPPDVF